MALAGAPSQVFHRPYPWQNENGLVLKGEQNEQLTNCNDTKSAGQLVIKPSFLDGQPYKNKNLF